jgi:predicted alpha/beta hydrolase
VERRATHVEVVGQIVQRLEGPLRTLPHAVQGHAAALVARGAHSLRGWAIFFGIGATFKMVMREAADRNWINLENSQVQQAGV